ncbi:GNAT family N-acetyltransferase [Candidatus Pacearchaeota archaeon]|nr:GNAT family N-acetyltransferase [Candidatus Pacearchaeota archaeon]
MFLDYVFREINLRNLKQAIGFVAEQDLGYPNYQDWIIRTGEELSSGQKHGILAYSNGIVLGDIIFQKHKQVPNFYEIKNIRVLPELRGRHFAAFMLKQAELEMQNSAAITIDARKEQGQIINFLASQKYIPIAEVPLYDSHNDVVMVKFRDKLYDSRRIFLVKSVLLH